MATWIPQAVFSAALAARRAWVIEQFGQTNDQRTNNGSTGCADTCIQYLVWFWKGMKLTHNAIRSLGGNTNPARGLFYNQVQTIVRRTGLPYETKLRMTADEMLKAAYRGPVLFGEKYDWHPEWFGYRYGGRTADGKPNGYAGPMGGGGKTQLSGFDGAHAAILLGSKVVDGALVIYTWEPNHGSPSRPEKPVFDSMNLEQWRTLVRSYELLGRSTYAVIPTKTYNG